MRRQSQIHHTHHAPCAQPQNPQFLPFNFQVTAARRLLEEAISADPNREDDESSPKSLVELCELLSSTLTAVRGDAERANLAFELAAQQSHEAESERDKWQVHSKP